MIVKDEQPFLDGCLLSLRGLVDEIVIVDTGSRDASPDIARRHGARVIEWAWRNDFAAARNVGLDAATSDWLLYIDADERLADTSHEGLRAGLDSPDAFAGRVRFRVNANSTLYREYRLLRNDPRLRFKGTIHETIRPDLDTLQREIGAWTVDVPAKLVHLGYDGDMAVKYRRNLPLLRNAIEREPERIYYWNDLAQTLAALGEIDEAIAISSGGLERKAPETPIGLVSRSALIHTHARLRLQQGGYVRELIEQGLAHYPANWSLRFLRARAAIDAGDPASAIPDLEALVAQDPDAICDDSLAHDRRIFGCYAYELMGVARLRLGDRAGAARAFAQAAEAAPDIREYRIKAVALGADPAIATPGSASASDA
jgi:glycosyltransferase involved in cell wall biosynthesis